MNTLQRLTPATSKTVMELTEKLITEQNLTAFMVTHDMEDAIRYGSRLIMLHQGRIVVDIQQEENSSSQCPIISVVQTKQRHGIKRRSSTFIFIIRKRMGQNERPPSFSFLLSFCFMYQPLFLRKLFCSLLLPDRMDGKGA